MIEAEEDGGFEIVDYPSDEDDEEAMLAAKLAAQDAEALTEMEEDEEDEDDELAHVPDVRDGGVIKFNFTPRIFPTPCLLYTSPSPRDGLLSRMPSSA